MRRSDHSVGVVALLTLAVGFALTGCSDLGTAPGALPQAVPASRDLPRAEVATLIAYIEPLHTEAEGVTIACLAGAWSSAVGWHAPPRDQPSPR
jgi:hypothetical protein